MKQRQWAVLFAGGIAALGLGTLASWQPFAALGFALALPVLVAALRQPLVLLYAALGSVALGQLARIPPLQGGAPLVADGFLAGLFIAWLVWAIWKRESFPRSGAHLAWLGFLAVALIALIWTPYPVRGGEFLDAFLYWARLVIYSSLGWSIPMFLKRDADLKQGFAVVQWAGVTVLLAGFVQLLVLPDIGVLGRFGWDPHVGRFVSTFLDPNYLGGYLAMLLAFFCSINLEQPRVWRWMLIATTLVAGLLTYSRSGYLALVVAVAIVVARYSWKLLLITAICVIPLAMSIPRIADRVRGGFSLDTTSRQRIESWEHAIQIINAHPLLGVGYNNYEIAQQELGIIPATSVSHASAGSDSSLLNVAATTGLVGFLLFCLSGFLVWLRAFRLSRTKKIGKHVRIAAYTLVVSIPALLVNALFVNALFYPLLLIVSSFFIGAMYVEGEES